MLPRELTDHVLVSERKKPPLALRKRDSLKRAEMDASGHLEKEGVGRAPGRLQTRTTW